MNVRLRKSRSLLSPCPESSLLLSSRFVPALVPAPVPTLISRPGSPTVLLIHYVPTPATSAALSLPRPTPSSYLRFPTLSFSRLISAPIVSRCGISVSLLPLPMFGPSFPLESSNLKTFKQTLFDEP